MTENTKSLITMLIAEFEGDKNEAKIEVTLELLKIAMQLESSDTATLRPVPPDKPVHPSDRYVVYGKGGYTDNNDPRDVSCQSHKEVGGLTTAIWLQVECDPARPYRLESVRMISEADSGGKHIAYVEQDDHETVALLTGFNGFPGSLWDDVLVHAPTQEVVLNGKFNVPNLGPLAIALVNGDMQIISDTVGSIGLPGGHHICLSLVFERRHA